MKEKQRQISTNRTKDRERGREKGKDRKRETDRQTDRDKYRKINYHCLQNHFSVDTDSDRFFQKCF